MNTVVHIRCGFQHPDYGVIFPVTTTLGSYLERKEPRVQTVEALRQLFFSQPQSAKVYARCVICYECKPVVFFNECGHQVCQTCYIACRTNGNAKCSVCRKTTAITVPWKV